MTVEEIFIIVSFGGVICHSLDHDR